MQLEKVALKGLRYRGFSIVGAPVARDRGKKLGVGIYDRESGSLDSLIRTYRPVGRQKNWRDKPRCAGHCQSTKKSGFYVLSSSCFSEDRQTTIRNSSAISSPSKLHDRFFRIAVSSCIRSETE